MKKTVKDIDVQNKRVLVRVDFNVPLKKGRVTDDTRIRASVPTIEYLIEQGATVILCSHLGRPKGQVQDDLKLDPVAERLSEILGRKVTKLDDCFGPEVEAAVGELKPGDVCLLENTRFHEGEKKNDPQLAEGLARLADVFVNDAFAAAHRAHASTEGVGRILPAAAGLLMAKEIEALSEVRDHPEKPLAAILGGAKIADKIGLIDNLIKTADRILIGGGMANTFLKSLGKETGQSLVEDDQLSQAKRLMDQAAGKILIPNDVVIADDFAENARSRIVLVDDAPTDWRIMDVGPRTLEEFKQAVSKCKTVIWNGPMGVFEMPAFAEGTKSLAKKLAGMQAKCVVGGGDSVAAINQVGVADQMYHVSTGGGAFMEFMEGRELPGVAILQDK
jgi:phosphoglycerate kinase